MGWEHSLTHWTKDEVESALVAAGTFALALFTAGLGRATRDASKAEQERFNETLGMQEQEDRLRRLNEERDQATRVSYWFVGRGYSSGGGEPATQLLVLNTSNTSDRPVYDVYIDLAIRPDHFSPPAFLGHFPVEIEALPPHSPEIGRPLQIPIPANQVAQGVLPIPTEKLAHDIRFTDAAGRRWVRTGKGQLLQESDPRWQAIAGMPVEERVAQEIPPDT